MTQDSKTTPDGGPASPGESDTQLLKLCAQEDREAWGKLVQRYQNLVYSTALNIGLDADDAGDVFQEVFLELYRSAGRIRRPEALPRWLIVATRRLCYKVATRRRRLLPDISEDLVDPSSLADEEVVASEARLRLENALSELGGRCAKLLRVLFFSAREVSYDEVAEKMGMARGSVGPIRIRCLNRLKRVLGEIG